MVSVYHDAQEEPRRSHESVVPGVALLAEPEEEAEDVAFGEAVVARIVDWQDLQASRATESKTLEEATKVPLPEDMKL